MAQGIVVNKDYVSKREAKLAVEEAELEAMEKEFKGETVDEDSEKEVQAEGTTDEPKADESDESLSAEEKTFKKRYGDLRRHMADEKKKWESEVTTLKSRRPELVAPASDEDIDEWQKANPQIASIVESIADRKANEKFEGTSERIKQLDIESEQLKREKAENSIRKKHSDFDELVEDDAFHSWAAEQPKLIQNALYEDPDDYQSVIRAIDLYKADKGLTVKADKENALKAAGAVNAKGTSTPIKGEAKPKWSESKVAKLSMDAYAKHAEEIDKAMSDGEFIYDLQ